MYSNFMVCEERRPGERCFYIRKYYEGEYIELCHEHVSKSRMSSDTALSALHALMVKHSGWCDSFALQAFMNSRGKEPSRVEVLRVHVEYPKRGILRRLCTNSNIEGWVDEDVKV